MNSFLRYALVTAVVAAPAMATSGCRVTVETMDRFEGTPVADQVAWTTGKTVTIKNDNGEVVIGVGSQTDTVLYHATPFTMEFPEDSEKAVDAMKNDLVLKVEVDGSGNVVIHGDKLRGTYPGFELHVTLPSSFDAVLNVNSGNGPLDISGVAAASHANVVQDNGSTNIKLGNAVIDVFSNNASVDVEVGGGASGKVETDNGSVNFYIPTGANATIQAQAHDGGEVYVEPSVPASWVEASNGPAAKSYTLNSGGGNYLLNAHGTGLADVVIVPQ